MKIIIESTTKIVKVNGVDARVWEGKTDSGIPIHCFITRIAVQKNEDADEFLKELQECKPPSPDVAGYFFNLILN